MGISFGCAFGGQICAIPMPQQDQTIMKAELLRTLGHPLRIRTVELLSENGEMAVNQLCECLHIEQSLMSHHLGQMRSIRLVEARRDGKQVFYSMNFPEVNEMVKLLRAIKMF